MMEYIINSSSEDFNIILFAYDGRNWEICIDIEESESRIQYLISDRISNLVMELDQYGDYDHSNLYEDYTKNNIKDGN